MSRFLDRLCMELVCDEHDMPLENREGRQLYKVLRDFRYQSDVANMTITVPADMLTDLASVPRLPIVYDAFGDYAQMPAVVHDFLYSPLSHALVSRATADEVLLEAMKLTGVPYWRRYAIYWGVRAGGASHYQTD